jgi:hypothetical protein
MTDMPPAALGVDIAAIASIIILFFKEKKSNQKSGQKILCPLLRRKKY